MDFIANKINGTFLRSFLPTADEDVEAVSRVLAAIAYGDDESTLIKNSLDNDFRLDIYVRYDHTVPVHPRLLETLLNSFKQHISCFVVPDYLHCKVIWWVGYGAYIGSANLTDRAWNSNIETGVFHSDAELEASGLDRDLEQFFDELNALREAGVAMPLSKEIIENQRAILALRQDKLAAIDKDSRKLRRVAEWQGPAGVDRKKGENRRESRFLKEWNETLTILRSIAEQAPDFRPAWVAPDAPGSWQADQFLHAHYYNRVRDGLQHPFNEHFQRNRGKPQVALIDSLKWWQSQPTPPTFEDVMLNTNAPFIREKLARDSIAQLSLADFSTICGFTHATKDHIIKIPLSTLGIPDRSSMTREERIPIYAQWLWGKRNQLGWDVRKLISYVLYGGPAADMPKRLFTAARNGEYALPHYGLNSLAEIVGWALPDVAPPRNGRTSKALRSLGYDVSVY